MATIGTFEQQPDGSFKGSISTLALELPRVEFRPCEPTEGGPNFRIFVGHAEVGAAWAKTSREDREYLSVKLDDPSFSGPIYASLVHGETEHRLIWSRSRSAS
jgi:uncharacterized protein (DUF736 family)